ncbi:NAD(+)/NADH kinase [Caldisericum exile]|uniref:NAD kinase n=1 Tax=Caldisericum exile (strain DSM 21853 / NBRC 104410 / AZM16c01) TaxID=511051 RepID=A0A7U6JEN6_CALEA|nr:NAD(+)/NADH kinase [Caldisericum exile]BAL80916.1 inorganic polyphosphate/ATP-NAD kinase [Caldisericum exile AZM16c01]
MGKDNVKKIGIFYKDDPYLIEIARELESFLKRKNIDVFKNSDFGNLKEDESLVILSLGGDGTFLGASRIAIQLNASVLGINLGNFGFLTDVEGMDVFIAIEKLLRGEYFIEERMTLSCEINGNEENTFCSVNDFVVLKGAEDKILQYEVAVNGIKAGRFRSDGIVVSTSTGSTAYALSVGGPIIVPQAQVFELNHIAPHKLSARPLILAESDILEIEIESDGYYTFLRDGLKVGNIKRFDRLEFKKNRRNLKIVHLKGKNFFDVLNKKFGWGY